MKELVEQVKRLNKTVLDTLSANVAPQVFISTVEQSWEPILTTTSTSTATVRRSVTASTSTSTSIYVTEGSREELVFESSQTAGEAARILEAGSQFYPAMVGVGVIGLFLVCLGIDVCCYRAVKKSPITSVCYGIDRGNYSVEKPPTNHEADSFLGEKYSKKEVQKGKR